MNRSRSTAWLSLLQNNNAVENISKELPERSQVMREEDGNEKEQTLVKWAEELDYFPRLADAVMGKEDTGVGEPASWGLFSAPLGSSKRRQDFYQQFRYSKEHQTIDNYFWNNDLSYSLDDWDKTKREMRDLEDKIEKKREELKEAARLLPDWNKTKRQLQELLEDQKENEHLIKKLQVDIADLENKQNDIEELISLISPSVFWWASSKKRQQKKEADEHKTQLYEIKKERFRKKEELSVNEAKDKELQQQVEKLKQSAAYMNQIFNNLLTDGVTIPDEDYWEGNYETRQKQVPWLSPELNHLRSKLFLQSMKVHKVFLYLSKYQVMSNLNVFFNDNKYNCDFEEDREFLKAAWQTLFLVVPVISTTFASVSNMFKYIDAEEIGYSYIDEAGQALPQAAVGLLYRSKHVVAVGDPLQIEPVITMPETLIRDIAHYFGVNEHYLSMESSVQSVADSANSIGTYIDKKWIGIPLWVHRRCADPMFTMANEIAYRNKMVLANVKSSDKSRWIDVIGKTNGSNYVPEEGKAVLKLVDEAFAVVSIEDPLPSLYIITPFKAVKDELIRKIKRNNKKYGESTGRITKEINLWIYNHVGTVHTFQGKEADTVIFVIGTDRNKLGAANWIVQKPNLINVAITRAKKNLIVVGDQKRLSKLDYFDVVSAKLMGS
ncbi:DEAD/DEAH box helicase [Alkalicoccobacillus plakortidis]|uniref:DNA2/NAM7 family helicase n=1 Tax=Alkalicoccobacillus plakortidis TaxID=444060 RepID=A0ABT0XJD5_9BACI|nr:DEAD/DEAH box helicase [Alkalicoccobacillus plakortidis]MCM2675870.1 DNA2/NAM7 family helicase [Alkalicoccobacillus plakortidis]